MTAAICAVEDLGRAPDTDVEIAGRDTTRKDGGSSASEDARATSLRLQIKAPYPLRANVCGIQAGAARCLGADDRAGLRA